MIKFQLKNIHLSLFLFYKLKDFIFIHNYKKNSNLLLFILQKPFVLGNNLVFILLKTY